MKKNVHQSQLNQNADKLLEVEHEILQSQPQVLNEVLKERNLSHSILDAIVGGVDQNLSTDSTLKEIEGSEQLDGADTENESTEVFADETISTESTGDNIDSETDNTQFIADDSSLQAPETTFDFGDGNNDFVTLTQGTTEDPWFIQKGFNLFSISSDADVSSNTQDGSMTLTSDAQTVTLSADGTIDILFNDEMQTHFTLTQTDQVLFQTKDSDEAIQLGNHTLVAQNTDGSFNFYLPNNDSDSDDLVAIKFDPNSENFVVERGSDSLTVPQGAHVSYDSTNDILTFASEALTLRIRSGDTLTLGFNALGSSINSVPERSVFFQDGPDGDFLDTEFSTDTSFVNFNEDSVVINNGDELSLIDAQGNLSNAFLGEFDSTNNSITLMINNQSVVINDDFTPQVDKEGGLTFINSENTHDQQEVIHVDANGDVEHAWGVTDVEAWLTALNTGEAVDELAQSQLTFTQSGQATLQSKDLDETIQFDNRSLVTQADGITNLDINNDRGNFQLSLHADGSVEIQKMLLNQEFGDPNSENAINLQYGLGGKATVSWGENNQLNFSKAEINEEDGSVTLLQGSKEYSLSAEGVIEGEGLHIDPNGDSYLETQAGTIPLNLNAFGPDASFATSLDGSLNINIVKGTDPLFGPINSTVSIELDANADAFVVKDSNLNTLTAPKDAHITYNDSTHSISFASDDQTLTITRGNTLSLHFNHPNPNTTTGLTLSTSPDGKLALSGFNNQNLNETYPQGARFTNLADGSVLVSTSSGEDARIIDPQGNHVSAANFGSTTLTSLSNDKLEPMGDTLALVPNKGESDIQILIDSEFTPSIDDAGLLTFVKPTDETDQFEVIHVDTNGDIQHAWGVTDVDAWVNALNSGEEINDLVHTQLTVTQTGQASIQSKDLAEPVQLGEANVLSLTRDIIDSVNPDLDESQIEALIGTTTVEINNEMGDNQMLIHADGSISNHDVLTNQVLGDITVNYELGGQASLTWGEDNQLILPPSLTPVQGLDGTLTFTNGPMTVQVTANGELTVNLPDHSVVINPQGNSFLETVLRDNSVERTALGNAVYSITPEGALSIKSTGPNGEIFETQLQSKISDPGSKITTEHEFASGQDATLTIDHMIVDDPQLGQIDVSSGQITFANTPAAFVLKDGEWTDGHGVSIAGDAVPSILENGHIQFTFKDENNNTVIYEFSTQGDLVGIQWPDDTHEIHLTQSTEGNYIYSVSDQSGSTEVQSTLTLPYDIAGNPQLITSDGTIFLEKDNADGSPIAVAINAAGVLSEVNADEIPTSPNNDLDINALAAAIVSYGIANLPYWTKDSREAIVVNHFANNADFLTNDDQALKSALFNQIPQQLAQQALQSDDVDETLTVLKAISDEFNGMVDFATEFGEGTSVDDLNESNIELIPGLSADDIPSIKNAEHRLKSDGIEAEGTLESMLTDPDILNYFNVSETQQILNSLVQGVEEPDKQAQMNDELQARAQSMQLEHESLFNQITAQQIDTLTHSIIFDDTQPEWASEILPQLNTHQLDKLLAVMLSRLPGGADSSTMAQQLTEAVDTLKQAQADQINQIAQTILDESPTVEVDTLLTNYLSDWSEQELNDPNSKFGALDQVQKSQLTSALRTLAQAQEAEVKDKLNDPMFENVLNNQNPFGSTDALQSSVAAEIFSDYTKAFTPYQQHLFSDKFATKQNFGRIGLDVTQSNGNEFDFIIDKPGFLQDPISILEFVLTLELAVIPFISPLAEVSAALLAGTEAAAGADAGLAAGVDAGLTAGTEAAQPTLALVVDSPNAANTIKNILNAATEMAAQDGVEQSEIDSWVTSTLKDMGLIRNVDEVVAEAKANSLKVPDWIDSAIEDDSFIQRSDEFESEPTKESGIGGAGNPEDGSESIEPTVSGDGDVSGPAEEPSDTDSSNGDRIVDSESSPESDSDTDLDEKPDSPQQELSGTDSNGSESDSDGSESDIDSDTAVANLDVKQVTIQNYNIALDQELFSDDDLINNIKGSPNATFRFYQIIRDKEVWESLEATTRSAILKEVNPNLSEAEEAELVKQIRNSSSVDLQGQQLSLMNNIPPAEDIIKNFIEDFFHIDANLISEVDVNEILPGLRNADYTVDKLNNAIANLTNNDQMTLFANKEIFNELPPSTQKLLEENVLPARRPNESAVNPEAYRNTLIRNVQRVAGSSGSFDLRGASDLLKSIDTVLTKAPDASIEVIERDVELMNEINPGEANPPDIQAQKEFIILNELSKDEQSALVGDTIAFNELSSSTQESLTHRLGFVDDEKLTGEEKLFNFQEDFKAGNEGNLPSLEEVNAKINSNLSTAIDRGKTVLTLDENAQKVALAERSILDKLLPDVQTALKNKFNIATDEDLSEFRADFHEGRLGGLPSLDEVNAQIDAGVADLIESNTAKIALGTVAGLGVSLGALGGLTAGDRFLDWFDGKLYGFFNDIFHFEDENNMDDASNPDPTSIEGISDTFAVDASNQLANELSGFQITSLDQALDAANELLSDPSVAISLGNPDPRILANDLLNTIQMTNAVSNQYLLFNALPSDQQTEIIDTIGAVLNGMTDSDINSLSSEDRVTIGAVLMATGQSPEEIAANAQESLSLTSTAFTDMMGLLQHANSSEFLDQLQAYNEASTLDKAILNTKANLTLSNNYTAERSDQNEWVQAEAIAVGKALAEPGETLNSGSLADDIQAREIADPSFAETVKAMEVVNSAILAEDPNLAKEMTDAFSYELALNKDPSTYSDAQLAALTAATHVFNANVETGVMVTADNFAKSLAAENPLTPREAFEAAVNVIIDGGNQNAIDNFNTLVKDFPNSINNQATSAMINNNSLSASTTWAPNVEGQQLGALVAKYTVDNDLDADSISATLNTLNDDVIQKQDTRAIMNDIQQAIEQKIASDDAFAADVANRESLDLAIAATSNTDSSNPQQLLDEMVAAVSHQLSTLHSIDDFNALSDQAQATLAAAIAAWGVQADINAETQSPNDFDTVVQMGNALSDQTVIEAETELLNTDQIILDAGIHDSANTFSDLSQVRANLITGENSYDSTGLMNLGFLLAQSFLEGLDSNSLIAQEDSTFTSAI